MRIIGVRIHSGDGLLKSPTEVMRGVKAGWFPFGNYPEPVVVNGAWSLSYEINDEGIYNSFSEWPRISVTGIVGKNGSGKSSLLDYLLMIMNNTAYHLLYDQYAKDEEKPKLACGLCAELYFETNGSIRRLKCRDTDVYYSEGGEELLLKGLPQDVRYGLTSCLFYMVLSNPGSYSLNTYDYIEKSKITNETSKISDNWLNGVFSLEQNYIFPITITPNRNGGNIDVNKQKDEVVEKLIALMLFAKSRGYQFMPDYDLARFKYEYNPYIEGQMTDRLGLTAKNKEIAIEDLSIVAGSIIEGWANELDCTELYFSEVSAPNEKEPLEIFKMLVKYIGYETVHLCVYYEKFRSRFDVINFIKEHQRNGRKYEQGIMKEINQHFLFNVICNDNTNLTYGIRKCIRTIREVKKTGVIKHSYLAHRMSKTPSALLTQGEPTLEDILFRLPPPIYQLDALLVKQSETSNSEHFSVVNRDASEIQLSKLSSGEKQWMYSLTSTIFHIKSMDESIARSKDIRFNHVCLLFDEAELYYHPEYQQNFLFNLLLYLSWIRLGTIQSVQIVIATHSPFILSDIIKDNILFMKEGNDFRAIMTAEESEEFEKFNTFGANYYDLLRNGFFLKSQAVGKFAALKLEEYLERVKKGEVDDSLKQQIEKIGDPIIKGYLLFEMNQHQMRGYVQD